VDGETYKSIDQYYQWQKVKDLTGLLSAKFTDGSTRDYSSLARDLIRQASVNNAMFFAQYFLLGGVDSTQ
jgi:hypothetical protein